MVTTILLLWLLVSVVFTAGWCAAATLLERSLREPTMQAMEDASLARCQASTTALELWTEREAHARTRGKLSAMIDRERRFPVTSSTLRAPEGAP
jgi:hypothetical protein